MNTNWILFFIFIIILITNIATNLKDPFTLQFNQPNTFNKLSKDHRKWITKPRMDIDGNNLKIIPNSTVQSCLKAGQIASNCVGVVFDNNTNTCILKKTVGKSSVNPNRTYFLPIIDRPKDLDGDKINNWQSLYGANFPGNDIKSIPNTSESSCIIACAASNSILNKKCIGALYDVSTGSCWLKSALTNNSILDKNKVVYLQKGVDTSIVSGLDFGGNDIQSTSSNSMQECNNKCKQKNGCVGGLYGPTNNNCWLKSKLIANSKHTDRIISV